MINLDDIAHPWLLFWQGVGTIASLVLYLFIRKNPWGLPQLMLLLTLTKAVNLTCRATLAQSALATRLFYVTDIALYAMWAIVTIMSVYVVWVVQKEQKAVKARQLEEKLMVNPGMTFEPEPQPTDFLNRLLDKWQLQVGIAFAVLIMGVVMYNYLTVYEAGKQASAELVIRTNTIRAKAEQEARQELQRTRAENQAFHDTLLGKVDSSLSVGSRLLNGQSTILHSTQQTINQQAAKTRQTIKATTTVKLAPPIEPLKPKVPEEKQEKGFWKRWFGRGQRDSINQVRVESGSRLNLGKSARIHTVRALDANQATNDLLFLIDSDTLSHQ